MRLPKALLVVFLLLLIVLVVGGYFYSRLTHISKAPSSSIDKGDEEKVAPEAIDSIVVRGNLIQFIGKFSSGIYDRDGFSAVDATVDEKPITFILALSGSPIMVTLVDDINNLPSSRRIEGKFKDELVKVVKEEKNFIAKAILPSGLDSPEEIEQETLTSLPEEEQKYYLDNWEELSNFVSGLPEIGKIEKGFGLVSELIIENK